jgi:hypothetical protein
MIRAWIGRVVLHCIDRAALRAAAKGPEVREVKLAEMTDAQVHAWVKGQRIDWSQTGTARIPHRGRVS